MQETLWCFLPMVGWRVEFQSITQSDKYIFLYSACAIKEE